MIASKLRFEREPRRGYGIPAPIAGYPAPRCKHRLRDVFDDVVQAYPPYRYQVVFSAADWKTPSTRFVAPFPLSPNMAIMVSSVVAGAYVHAPVAGDAARLVAADRDALRNGRATWTVLAGGVSPIVPMNRTTVYDEASAVFRTVDGWLALGENMLPRPQILRSPGSLHGVLTISPNVPDLSIAYFQIVVEVRYIDLRLVDVFAASGYIAECVTP